MSIAETRRVVAALDDPPANPHELLGTAHAAITPPADDALDLAGAEALAARLGWKPGMCDPAVLHAVARGLQGLERVGFTVPEAVMAEYLASARRIADAEIAGVPEESAEAAVRYVVLGSVLVEPLLLALRRVAQQVSSGSGLGWRPEGALDSYNVWHNQRLRDSDRGHTLKSIEISCGQRRRSLSLPLSGKPSSTANVRQ